MNSADQVLMSKAASPTRFSANMDHFYDPNFTADISQRMRVPKRIKVNGANDDDTTNNYANMIEKEKFDMHVPDRILVIDYNWKLDDDDAGQDQHLGTKAPPRELVLENSVMPRDPGTIRIQTPPRVITLDEHYFPSADDYIRHNQSDPCEEKIVTAIKPKQKLTMDHRFSNRDSTPPLGPGGEGLTASEEIIHLRRQMAKLNRRIMAVELDNLQRQQREKILFALGMAYFVIKTLLWASRSS